MTPEVTAPPTMAGWNLALRFGLELLALTGLGVAAWRLTNGPIRFLAVVAVPLAATVAWVVFNVIGDPSRSGAAPVEVAGWVRLAIELTILVAGAIAFALAGRRDIGIAVALLIAIHYVASLSRVQWLLDL